MLLNKGRLFAFKNFCDLWKQFGVESSKYENVYDFEQYMRLAQPAIAALHALGAGTELDPAVILSHEYMGMPTALAAILGRRADTPQPDRILCIIDATNLERNLYLVHQVLDLGRPVIVVLNMMDLAAEAGMKVFPDKLAKDNANRLLSRGPRFRMDAEMIRDNALAIAGLLNPKLGGPPIHPYQPDGLWVKVGGQRYDYVVSPGDEKFRRGLYVIWKRGAPYPSFVNFDANSRLACRVKRPRSNTPLQALTLINDPVYVEAAMAFAKRVLTEQPSANTADRLTHAFRLATARAPRAEELATLTQLLEASRAKDAKAAKEFLGKFDLPAAVSAEEFAAWYAVAAALLNLDETISKG